MLETEGTVRRMRTAVLISAGIAALALPAGASAQAGDEPAEAVFTAAEASAQLEQAVEALATTDPAAAHPTDELRHLAAALPSLEGPERRQARAILSRPPANDAAREPFGAEWPRNPGAETLETAHFVIHWPEGLSCSAPKQGCPEPDLTDESGSSAPDYIDQVAAAAEQSLAVQNGELGWPNPKPDDGKGGDDRIDVYVADICNENGGSCIFGYANTDDSSPTCQSPPFKCFAYLVLDNDYNFEEFGYADPGVPLRVTTAHEYNHILQFRLDTMQDGWMFESTAVWSEEQVFPDDDDWLFYLDAWKRTPRQPLTKFTAGGGLKVYGSAVWNHWLELEGGDYGPDVILDAWKGSRKTKPKDFAVAAYDRAIKRNGGKGFSQEFGRFAAATAEWQVEDGDFPGDDANEPDETQFPDVERDGWLKPGGKRKRFKLDHTAYRLLDVDPGSRNVLKLRVKAPRNVRTAIALVGRVGDPETGDIDKDLEYTGKGRRLTARLGDVQEYDRVTAMVANADGRIRGRAGNDWNYTRDNQRFRVTLR
jgi:hypothetical protein